MSIPSTTVEFLDALKAHKGLSTDYQLFKAMGWKQGTVSSYRCGKTCMSGPHAIRVADELSLPRAYVLACMSAERENNTEVAGVWQEIANRFRGAAAIILIALVGLCSGQDAHAAQRLSLPCGGSGTAADIYSVKSRRRRRRWHRGVMTLFQRLPILAPHALPQGI
jgi:hypothetical protein